MKEKSVMFAYKSPVYAQKNEIFCQPHTEELVLTEPLKDDLLHTQLGVRAFCQELIT